MPRDINDKSRRSEQRRLQERLTPPDFAQTGGAGTGGSGLDGFTLWKVRSGVVDYDVGPVYNCERVTIDEDNTDYDDAEKLSGFVASGEYGNVLNLAEVGQAYHELDEGDILMTFGSFKKNGVYEFFVGFSPKYAYFHVT